MTRGIKYGKLAIVIFLTILIWVWADLSQDKRITIPNVTVTVAKASDPGLWVCFNNESLGLIDTFSVEAVELKGPASRTAEVERRLNKGSLDLQLFFVPEQEGITGSVEEYRLNVLDFLRRNGKMRELGLSIESCTTATVLVRAVQLVQKELTVECLDENGASLEDEKIEPPKITAYVPADWAGEKLIAKVRLTVREINQARSAAIKKKPFIELAPGQRREVSSSVEIKMPSAESVLKDYLVTATLGLALSPNLQRKYKVEVTNLNEVISPIAIKATAQAKQAYETQPYPPMTLYIFDEDEKVQGEQRRQVVYNLPWDFVRRGEIVPPQSPSQARFRLVPLSESQ